MVGVAKPFGRVKQALQELLAIEKWGFAKVVSVAVEKIEDEVNDRNLRDQVFAGGAHVHAFLQAFEVAVTLGIQSDDLSVKNSLAGGQSIGKRGQFGIALEIGRASCRERVRSSVV